MIIFAFLAGLVLGSFANVLIHRLPRMILAVDLDAHASTHPQTRGYNIAWPASHCPKCGTPLRWFHNIPLLSYLLLRGRCAFCMAPISLRYPLVELLAGLLMSLAYVRYGWAWGALVWGSMWIVCLALFFTDWEYFLLPDSMTLPLLWAGLLIASAQEAGWLTLVSGASGASGVPPVSLQASLWGAALGYASLFLVHYGFKWLRGIEGMGHGDFKLLAALGAWLGVTALLPMMLMASIMGVLAALLLPRLPFGQTKVVADKRGEQSSALNENPDETLGEVQDHVNDRHHDEAKTPSKPADPIPIEDVVQADLPTGAIAFGPYLIVAGFVVWCWPAILGVVYGY